MTVTVDRAANYLATATAIEQSTGPDRHLDAHIYDALGYQTISERRHRTGICWSVRGHGPLSDYGSGHWSSMSRFTYDLGDAYAYLARPLLSGAAINLELRPDRAIASMATPLGTAPIQSPAKTPALAVSGLIMRLMHWRASTPLPTTFGLSNARHALGFDEDVKKSYRNRYSADQRSPAGIHFEDMVAKGYARRAYSDKDMTQYAMTFEGAIRALQPGEALCGEDFPR